MHSRHQEEATSDHIRTPKLRCCVCHLHHGQAMKPPCNVIAELPTRQHANTTKSRSTKICTFFSVAVMLRVMQREVNTGHRYECRLHLLIITQKSFSQFRSASDLDCCFVAIPSWRKSPGPRIMRTLGSNTRERTQDNEKKQDEDSSFSKGIEILLSEIARKVYADPEKV